MARVITTLALFFITMFTNKTFPISELSREDLETLGFDSSKVDDATMERLASKLRDDYCEQLFWISLKTIAEYLEIPKNKK